MATSSSPKNFNILTKPKRLLARFLFGSKVMQGPFAGMRYISNAVGSAYWPKWMGIYERELTPVIDEICSRPFERIVDVGAAEGFYAIGFALRYRGAQVVAFEADPEGQRLIGELARVNDVEAQVSILGFCDSWALSKAVRFKNTLLIMDVEGFEAELLNPAIVPELKSTEILVELHEYLAPGLGDLLRQRFSESHKIAEVLPKARIIDDLPKKLQWFRFFFPWRVLQRVIFERPASLNGRVLEHSWLHLRPIHPGK